MEDIKSAKEMSQGSYASHNIPEDKVRQSSMSSESKKAPFMPAKIKHSNSKSQEDSSMHVVIKQVQSS